MRQPSIWKTLGIKATGDKGEIRRAYAKKLKITHPEDDPEGFKTLRAAYEQALQRAAWNTVPVEVTFTPPLAHEDEDEDEDEDDTPVAVTPDSASDAAPDQTPDETLEAPLPPPPPPPIDPDEARYQAACETLERQLRPRATASPQERLATLEAILTSPRLDSIATRDYAEFWLAHLISRTQPRSDALILRAIRYFGWNKDADGRRQIPGVYDILIRAEDVRFLQAIQSPNSDSHKAYRVLSQPPPPRSFLGELFPKAPRADVEALLGRIRRTHPAIEAELNADSVRAWDERLKHVDVSGVNLWTLVATPFCLLAALILFLAFGWDALGAYIFLAIPPVWGFVAVGIRYAYDGCKRWWHRRLSRGDNPWLAFGWGPALIALLVLAAAEPEPWLTGVTVFLSLVIVWWSLITGEADRNDTGTPWQFRLILSEFFLLAWWLFTAWDMPTAEAAWQMTPVVLAASVVSGMGRLPLLKRWLRLPMVTQRYTLIALIAAAIAAIGVLWSVYETDWLRPLAFAGGASVMLLARVPALSIPAWSSGFVRLVCYLTLVIARTQGGPQMTLAVIGTVLLGLTAVNAGVAFVRIKGR